MGNNVIFTKVDPSLQENESLLQQIAIWHNTTPKQWLVDYRITTDDISETIQSLVKVDGLALFLEVAKDSHENAIGFVWAYCDKEDEKRVIIKSLYVDPAYRKHGIASQLKEHLEIWCKRKGVSKIETTVHYTNKNMIALNEKLGYNAGMVTMTKKL